jgi:hypothetical protein
MYYTNKFLTTSPLYRGPAKEPLDEAMAKAMNPAAFQATLNVAVAAQVTAYGRELIRSLIHACGRNCRIYCNRLRLH